MMASRLQAWIAAGLALAAFPTIAQDCRFTDRGWCAVKLAQASEKVEDNPEAPPPLVGPVWRTYAPPAPVVKPMPASKVLPPLQWPDKLEYLPDVGLILRR